MAVRVYRKISLDFQVKRGRSEVYRAFLGTDAIKAVDIEQLFGILDTRPLNGMTADMSETAADTVMSR